MGKMKYTHQEIIAKLEPYFSQQKEQIETHSNKVFELDKKIELMKCIKRHRINPSCINKNSPEMRRLEDSALQEYFNVSMTIGQERFLDNLKKRSEQTLLKHKIQKKKFFPEVHFELKPQKENLDNFKFGQLDEEIEHIISSGLSPSVPTQEMQVESTDTEAKKSPDDNTSENSHTQDITEKKSPSTLKMKTQIQNHFAVKNAVKTFTHVLWHLLLLFSCYLFVLVVIVTPFALGISFVFYFPPFLSGFYILIFTFIISLVICPIMGISFYHTVIRKLRWSKEKKFHFYRLTRESFLWFISIYKVFHNFIIK